MIPYITRDRKNIFRTEKIEIQNAIENIIARSNLSFSWLVTQLDQSSRPNPTFSELDIKPNLKIRTKGRRPIPWM